MGGVGAWKDREKEAKERTLKWDLEEREAQRERMEQAKENGEVDDEAYDRYADLADEQGENEVDNVPKAADDDVSLPLSEALPHADPDSRSQWT